MEGDPVNFVDPLGLDECVPGGAGDGCTVTVTGGRFQNLAALGFGHGAVGSVSYIDDSAMGGDGVAGEQPKEDEERDRREIKAKICSGLSSMKYSGEAMGATGAVLFLAGQVTPLVPDGEALGGIVAGFGGLSWITAELGKGVMYLTGNSCK